MKKIIYITMILFTFYSCREDQTVIRLLSKEISADTAYIYKSIGDDQKIYLITAYSKLDSLDHKTFFSGVPFRKNVQVKILKLNSIEITTNTEYTYKTVYKNGISTTHKTKLILDKGDVIYDY